MGVRLARRGLAERCLTTRTDRADRRSHVVNTGLYAGVTSSASGLQVRRVLSLEVRRDGFSGVAEGCAGVVLGLSVAHSQWSLLPFFLPLFGAILLCPRPTPAVDVRDPG